MKPVTRDSAGLLNRAVPTIVNSGRVLMDFRDSDDEKSVGKNANEDDVNTTPSEGALSESPTEALDSTQRLQELSRNSPAVSLKTELNAIGGNLSSVLAARQTISPTLEQSLRMANAATRLSDALTSSSALKAVEQVSAGIERYQEAFRSSGIMKSLEAINTANDKWQEALRASPLIKAVETINAGVEKYQEAIQSSALAKNGGSH